MGQRLNIELIIDDGLYSNCYYHWSAYSSSAIDQALQIIKEYKKIKASNIKYDNVLLSYKLLHLMDETIDRDNSKIDPENKSEKVQLKWIEIPAGLSDSSYDMMKELYPNETFDKAIDRNVGLIGIHPNDVKNTEKWEEGRVELYINEEGMYFDVYWGVNNVDISMSDEDFENEYGMSKKEYVNLPELPKEPESINDFFHCYEDMISFDDVESLLEIINAHDAYKLKNGFVRWIT